VIPGQYCQAPPRGTRPFVWANPKLMVNGARRIPAKPGSAGRPIRRLPAAGVGRWSRCSRRFRVAGLVSSSAFGIDVTVVEVDAEGVGDLAPASASRRQMTTRTDRPLGRLRLWP